MPAGSVRDHREVPEFQSYWPHAAPVIDEAEYVLTVLHHMRNQARWNAELYDPDAQQRIEQAIARVEEVIRETQPKACTAEQSSQAA